MDKNEMKKLVLDFLKNGPATVTTIAKDGLGVSKASQSLKDFIEESVNNGTIKVDDSGKHTKYYVGKAQTKTETKTESKSSTVEKCKETDKTNEEVTQEGDFTVTKKDGKYTVKGYDKEYVLNPDQYLLVINGNPEYKVSTPKDVIQAIQTYTEARSMVTFTVKNVKTGEQISSQTDIKFADRVLFLDITKVNKGGF